MFDILWLNGVLFLAKQYFAAQEYEDAIKAFQEVAAKTETKKNWQYAVALHGIGAVLNVMEDYDEGFRYFDESLRIAQNVRFITAKQKRIFVGMINGDIGLCHGFLGNIQSGLEYSKAGIEILEKENAPEILRESQQGHAILLAMSGDLDAALKIAPNKAVLNAYILSLETNETMGDRLPLDALPFAYDLLKAQSNNPSKKQSEAGITQNQIGMIYSALGDHEKALKEHLSALEINRTEFGEYHVETAISYNNAGVQYAEIGDGPSAFNHMHKALKILEKIQPPDSPLIGDTCSNLSITYADVEEYMQQARNFAQRAFEIAQEAYGKDHPKTADALMLIARLNFKEKKYDKALAYSIRALGIKQEKLGKNNPYFINNAIDAAYLALLCNDAQTAHYIRDLMSGIPLAFSRVFTLPQENLRLKFLRELLDGIILIYSYVIQNPHEFGPEELYSFELSTKNINAEVSYAQAVFSRASDNPKVSQQVSMLSDLRYKYSKNILEADLDIEELDVIEKQIEAAEVELLRHYRGMDFAQNVRKAQLPTVQEELSAGTVIIEYGRVGFISDMKTFETLEKIKDHYYVYAVTASVVSFVDLGECEDIDLTIKSIVAGMGNEVDNEVVFGKNNDLVTLCTTAYNMLIAPIKKFLIKAEILYIVPDSELYRLPFELLIDENGKNLNETLKSISYLSSGRELIRSAKETSTNSIFIIANPNYDLVSNDLNEHFESSSINAKPPPSRDIRNFLEEEKIQDLPFTGVEAEKIASLFKTRATVVSGINATERSLAANELADILHISTHGFAFPAQEMNNSISEIQNSFERSKSITSMEDPMLRCGLLFTGVRNWLRGESLPEIIGDGILTGNDVLSLDLSNYSLLTLSACQTGLGEIQSGEGVKGLRRAFELAGVGSLVCTLWSVDDFSSALLMEKFYEMLLAAPEKNVAAALSAAKDYIKNISYDQLCDLGFANEAEFLTEALQYDIAVHGDKLLSHPYYWAGFIVQGKLFSANGNIYEGDFKEDKLDGNGKITSAN